MRLQRSGVTKGKKMELKKYIERLEAANPDQKVALGLGNPHSWRGRYDELAFEPVENTTVGEMLAEAKSALGTTYLGYKGGEFKMDSETDIHVDLDGHWSNGHQLWVMFLNLLLQEDEEQ